MRGYWINHVVDIKDPERFGAYAEASIPMFQGNNQYGAKILLFGPVAATVLGNPVQYAAVAEFNSVQASIEFWNDPDYAAARALMGPLDDESAVVDRRVCCIEGEPLTVSQNQGFWLNHVHDIIDEAAFWRYAEASMLHFTNTTFGTVVHQHAGEQDIQLSAAASARRWRFTTRPNTRPHWPLGVWREMKPTSFSVPYVQLRCHSREDSIDPATPKPSSMLCYDT